MNLVCTNTTRFIIPMLFQDSNYTEVLEKNFIDSYSFDYYEPEYDNKIIIISNSNETPRTKYTPIASYKRQNQYCFVYDIPDEFKKDYAYILKGKYDFISQDYFNILKEFWEEETIDIKYNFIREVYKVAI